MASDLPNISSLVRRAIKDGVPPAEVREFISDVVNACWAGDWADLYGLLEAASGLSKAHIAAALGVQKYDTLRFWREGKRIPQEPRFKHYAAQLSKLSGVDEQIMHEARSRSIAEREGGLVPRPGWAVEYSRACLELYHYLRRLRAEAGLPVEDVAEELGVDMAEYEAWEGGRRTPRPWKLRVLWKVLGRLQGVLLFEMQVARDRGAAATYNERRRKKQIRLDRVALVAFEEGCSRREAERRIKVLDGELLDYKRYDYGQECLRPDYIRRMRRKMAEANTELQRDRVALKAESWLKRTERLWEAGRRRGAK